VEVIDNDTTEYSQATVGTRAQPRLTHVKRSISQELKELDDIIIPVEAA